MTQHEGSGSGRRRRRTEGTGRRLRDSGGTSNVGYCSLVAKTLYVYMIIYLKIKGVIYTYTRLFKEFATFYSKALTINLQTL